MAGEEDDLPTEEGTPNEGLEAEADATDPDSENPEDGVDPEGAAEGDGASAGEGQQVDGEPARRQPSRGEVRFQKLSQTAKEATERATRAENAARELQERIARLERPAQATPQGPTPEQIALMTPDELINYRLSESDKRFQATLGQIQWQTYETGDKAAFNALKATDPLAAKYADEVETRLQQMRAAGQNVDRERLLTYIIGEKARAGRSVAKQRQQAQGQQRIARQTVRPGAARSDTAGNRGKVSEQEARDKRLENITF